MAFWCFSLGCTFLLFYLCIKVQLHQPGHMHYCRFQVTVTWPLQLSLPLSSSSKPYLQTIPVERGYQVVPNPSHIPNNKLSGNSPFRHHDKAIPHIPVYSWHIPRIYDRVSSYNVDIYFPSCVFTALFNNFLQNPSQHR